MQLQSFVCPVDVLLVHALLQTLRDALAKNKSLNHLALAENKVTGAQWEALLRRHGPVTAEVGGVWGWVRLCCVG